MAAEAARLESHALELDLNARAQLAERLLLSLDAPTEEENLSLWVAEAERRLRDLRTGKAKEITAREALERARTALL